MLLLAHRGASEKIPENTLAAFAEAMLLNADGVELDVHLTSDNEVVVIHDESTGRTSDQNLIVSHSSLLEIQKLRINEEHFIPTLQQVLNILPNNKIVNIEIKACPAIEKVLEIISNCQHSKIIISSFDWRILEKIKISKPEISVGVLFEEDFDSAFNFVKKINADYLNPDYRILTQSNIKLAHSAGLKICCYTVNDQKEKERLKTLGVDIVISDVVNSELRFCP